MLPPQREKGPPAKGGRMYPKFITPKTLTAQEQGRLLRAVRDQGSRRDRAILSLALGTGLRLRELVGLNVGDVSPNGRRVNWRVPLDPKITKGGRGGTAFLVAGVREDMRRGLRAKVRVKEPLRGGLAAPPFKPAPAHLPSPGPGPIPEVA